MPLQSKGKAIISLQSGYKSSYKSNCVRLQIKASRAFRLRHTNRRFVRHANLLTNLFAKRSFALVLARTEGTKDLYPICKRFVQLCTSTCMHHPMPLPLLCKGIKSTYKSEICKKICSGIDHPKG